MIVEITSTPISVNVWKQERMVLHLASQTPLASIGFWTNLGGNYNNPLARYTTDNNGDVYIDVTDYMRTYGTQVTKLIVYGNTLYEIVPTIKGLINPASVLIPQTALYAKNAPIIPPTMMYGTINGDDYEIAEIYATGSAVSVSGNATLFTNYIGDIEGNFTITKDNVTKTYTPRLMQCDKTYALVRWVSMTGVTRVHWMEVVKRSTATDGAYSLLPTDNEYIDIKGRVDGFTLRLDMLNEYDMWYYSDMLHSSKVEVSFNGTNYAQVQVTTKDITLPDGDAKSDGKLEVKVNYKRYDAVAM